eukprot:763020-Hanusia_phi.AAC.11
MGRNWMLRKLELRRGQYGKRGERDEEGERGEGRKRVIGRGEREGEKERAEEEEEERLATTWRTRNWGSNLLGPGRCPRERNVSLGGGTAKPAQGERSCLCLVGIGLLTRIAWPRGRVIGVGLERSKKRSYSLARWVEMTQPRKMSQMKMARTRRGRGGRGRGEGGRGRGREGGRGESESESESESEGEDKDEDQEPCLFLSTKIKERQEYEVNNFKAREQSTEQMRRVERGQRERQGRTQ